MQHFLGFVYEEVEMHPGKPGPELIEVRIAAHRGIPGRCSVCRRPAPGYDRLPERRWLFVPLWGIPTWFLYALRWLRIEVHRPNSTAFAGDQNLEMRSTRIHLGHSILVDSRRRELHGHQQTFEIAPP